VPAIEVIQPVEPVIRNSTLYDKAALVPVWLDQEITIAVAEVAVALSPVTWAGAETAKLGVAALTIAEVGPAPVLFTPNTITS
jgi:hypothetical protein